VNENTKKKVRKGMEKSEKFNLETLLLPPSSFVYIKFWKIKGRRIYKN
jgi:hypothetical protein